MYCAVVLAEMNRKEEALREGPEALEISPDDGMMLYNCACLYARLGESDRPSIHCARLGKRVTPMTAGSPTTRTSTCCATTRISSHCSPRIRRPLSLQGNKCPAGGHRLAGLRYLGECPMLRIPSK